jgi:isochorismate hydrolase
VTPLCRIEDSLLLIIDIQERLASAMPEQVLEQVVARSALLQQVAAILEIPVLRTEQYPRGLGNTLPGISDSSCEQCEVFEKTSFSCCGNSDFLKALHASHRRQVIITGMETHVCVLQTALELDRDGLEVYIAEDGVCSRGKNYHDNALRRMQSSGVIISNSESVIFEWLRDAAHAEFRQVSNLLKQL